MRVLTATIGALLISVSNGALAQEHDGEQPQGEPRQEMAQPERQCEPFPASMPQTWSHEGEATQQARTRGTGIVSTQGEVEQLLAQLPERRPGEAREAQQSSVTAEELVAQLPDGPAALEPQATTLTAKELVAQLPDGPATLEPQAPALAAEELVAQLPDGPAALEPRAPTLTAKELVAQLPDGPAALEPQAPALTAKELVAQLPKGPAAHHEAHTVTVEEIVAQLPGRRLPAAAPAVLPKTMTAGQLLAWLPARRLPEAPWSEGGQELRLPEAMKADMQQDDNAAETEMPSDPQWTALKEVNLETTLDLPRAVFAMSDGHAVKNVGRRYRTRDGRAKVAIWSHPNPKRYTPARYLRKTFNIPRTTIDYERSTADFAAVSGLYRGKIYYIRCNLSPAGDGSLHCFDLAYPAREKKSWDAIVTRMSQSLRPARY